MNMLLDFYTEIAPYSETVIFIGQVEIPKVLVNHITVYNDLVDVRQTGSPGCMVLHYLSMGTSAAGLTGCAYTRAMPAIFTQSRSCGSGPGMRCCVISIDLS